MLSALNFRNHIPILFLVSENRRGPDKTPHSIHRFINWQDIAEAAEAHRQKLQR